MVTILPKENDWADAFSSIGKGVSEGYLDRSDENALKKAVQDLKPNASPREILDAITGTKTYGKEAKQNVIKNYMGIAEFEETQKKNTIAQNKLDNKEIENVNKQNRKNAEAETIISTSKLNDAEKQPLLEAARRGELDPSRAATITSRPSSEPSEYDIAKNNAQRFEKPVAAYQEKAIASEQAMPLLETAILNNESYGKGEKFWDTTIDAINSPFLNQFKSKTGQELEAITPVSVAGFGSKMGGQLTNARQKLIEKKAVGIGRDKEANRMLLYLDFWDRKLDQIRAEESNKIISENKYGLPPKDFDEELRKRLKPYQKMIASDLDRVLDGKQPQSPISRLKIVDQYESQLEEGEVLVTDPKGNIGAIKEEDLELPEYKDYKRI